MMVFYKFSLFSLIQKRQNTDKYSGEHLMSNKKSNKNILEEDIEVSILVEEDVYDELIDIDLDGESGTFHIDQEDIDEMIENTEVYQDLTSYTETFQKVDKKLIDLTITSKITLLSILSVIVSVGLCLHIFQLTLQDLPNYEKLASLFNQHLSIGLILVSFVSISIAFLIASSVVNPLKKVRQAVTRVTEGNYSEPVRMYATDEIGKLIEYVNIMMTTLARKKVDKEKKILEYVIESKRKDKLNRELRHMLDRQVKETNSTYEFLFAAINSIEQGLFIFDKDGLCADLYTASCLDLFGVEPKNRSIFDVLNIHTEKELETYRTWLMTLFSDKFDLEMIIPLGPLSYVKGDIGDPDFKFIELQYFPMRDEDTDEILNVVAIGTDKTKSMISEQELREQKRNAQMVLSILKNRSLFHHFSIESNRILSDISGQFYRNVFDFDFIKLGVHSIKGMSASFYAHKIRDTCHKFENLIPEAIENISDPGIKNQVIEGVNEIRTEVIGFITKISHMTGHNFLESVIHRDIKLESLEQFSQKLRQVDSSIYDEFVTEFIKVPVGSFFNNVDSNVNKTSKKLSKKILPVNFTDMDIKIDPKNYVSFFQNLTHLFNNIVDHAIEAPNLRAELGKPENGSIKVTGFETDEVWGVTIEDDGRGIDPKVIRGKLEELNLMSQYENSTDEEVIYAIFHPDFSTQSSVSKLSGRGVGMSALRSSIDECGGHIEVSSVVGEGSRFTFTFEKNSNVKSLKNVA
jgi:two-component system chemotaxis sensor kinase CheA